VLPWLSVLVEPLETGDETWSRPAHAVTMNIIATNVNAKQTSVLLTALPNYPRSGCENSFAQ